ncbi:MAG: class I SAM-dependent methyltransferase [Pseudomonadota bacterium]
MSLPASLYTDLANYYDRFCAEVDYVEQCAFAQRVFHTFTAAPGLDYLDLACGTGQHLQIMQQVGFVPHGLDNSAEMLRQAAVRCPQATLQLCDLAAFTQQDAFDLITCFLYSLHYAHPTTAVAETLRRSYAALKPGGVLLFNAVDARGIQNDAGVTTYLDDGSAQLGFQSCWNYRGDGEVLDLHLTISRTSAQEDAEPVTQEWRDHHTMTALTFPQLQTLLEGIGFDVTVMEHDYSVMRPWDGLSSNAIFVACKPQ